MIANGLASEEQNKGSFGHALLTSEGEWLSGRIGVPTGTLEITCIH